VPDVPDAREVELRVHTLLRHDSPPKSDVLIRIRVA
jgi:hypothetical protein